YVLLVGLCSTLARVQQLLDGVLDGRVCHTPQVEHAVNVDLLQVADVFSVVVVRHQNSSTDQPPPSFFGLTFRATNLNGYMLAATLIFTRASSCQTPLTSCISSCPSARITAKSGV